MTCHCWRLQLHHHHRRIDMRRRHSIPMHQHSHFHFHLDNNINKRVPVELVRRVITTLNQACIQAVHRYNPNHYHRRFFRLFHHQLCDRSILHHLRVVMTITLIFVVEVVKRNVSRRLRRITSSLVTKFLVCMDRLHPRLIRTIIMLLIPGRYSIRRRCPSMVVILIHVIRCSSGILPFFRMYPSVRLSNEAISKHYSNVESRSIRADIDLPFFLFVLFFDDKSCWSADLSNNVHCVIAAWCVRVYIYPYIYYYSTFFYPISFFFSCVMVVCTLCVYLELSSGLSRYNLQ